MHTRTHSSIILWIEWSYYGTNFIFLSQIILLDECFFSFKFEIFIIEIDDISRSTGTYIFVY